ncbi:MAG: right-handed parallel beta-helix repeat-containing protein, partial [Acidobacteria bacterium]|nr:right-handed parallel beta-helix repeat-containing protein [Acidobacteriota bacterium]
MKTLLLLCAVAGLHAQTITLSPGDSLAAALTAKRIVVRGGDYFLSEPVVLGARNSGLTIEAAPGETPTFYGGRRIAGWSKSGERFWSAEAPADFRMLVVNGRRARPARLPATGYFTHETEFKVRWMGTSGGGWQRKPAEQELNTMRYKPGDLGPWLDLASVELTVYHMWDESLVRLRALDPQTRTLTFANPSGHPPGAFNVQRYVVWNVREGMTAPGQWYLDRGTRRVYYWPLEGEDMTRAEVLAPLVESIVRIEKARDITLRGLRFSVTNTPPVAGGFGAGKFEGAVALNDTDGCRLEDLTVFNTGGQGIKAQNARGLRIAGCEVRDTGACGIIARGEAAEIADNHVHHVGATYPSAIGIYCGGKNLLIAHNEVHDTPYTAVNCGGAGHRIESNSIYRAMLELHDGAAFYTIFGKGIVLRGNLVRDIPDTGGYGSSS